MDELDAPALVASIRAGDVARFADVVRRYDDAVRRCARSIGDAHTVEEVVQQTFYRAFKSLDALRDPQALEAWLLTIARRIVADHRRDRRRRREVTLRPVEPDLVADANPDRWIWDEVDALPDALRDVIVRRYRDGLSYADIARALGVPHSTVRGRIYEARKALRHRLVRRGDDR